MFYVFLKCIKWTHREVIAPLHSSACLFSLTTMYRGVDAELWRFMSRKFYEMHGKCNSDYACICSVIRFVAADLRWMRRVKYWMYQGNGCCLILHGWSWRIPGQYFQINQVRFFQKFILFSIYVNLSVSLKGKKRELKVNDERKKQRTKKKWRKLDAI